jgi:hypothetical protein
VSGRRVVVILIAVFVAAAVLACGLAFLNRPRRTTETISRVTVSVGPAAPRTALRPLPPVAVPSPSREPAAVCPRNRAGVVPARAGAATQRRVDAAWKRIEDWLAGHAAKSRRALRPPAAQARIDAVQRQMSVPFPADLVASLRRHDGVAEMGFALPPFYTPAPVDRILADWTVNCDVASDLSLPGWWDPAFIPFAAAVTAAACWPTSARTATAGSESSIRRTAPDSTAGRRRSASCSRTPHGRWRPAARTRADIVRRSPPAAPWTGRSSDRRTGDVMMSRRVASQARN